MVNIAAKGAAAVLIYNNIPGLEELTFDPTYITQLMPAADGQYVCCLRVIRFLTLVLM